MPRGHVQIRTPHPPPRAQGPLGPLGAKGPFGPLGGPRGPSAPLGGQGALRALWEAKGPFGPLRKRFGLEPSPESTEPSPETVEPSPESVEPSPEAVKPNPSWAMQTTAPKPRPKTSKPNPDSWKASQRDPQWGPPLGVQGFCLARPEKWLGFVVLGLPPEVLSRSVGDWVQGRGVGGREPPPRTESNTPT